MHTQYSTDNLQEEAGYFAVSGAHLHTVLHRVVNPVARILLVGAFASERHFSYHAWIRWARYLAARQIEVLRYDYRGVGESTGTFEQTGFANWREDNQLLANWIADRSPAVPLILHGLELGAIFAGNCFNEGTGDALLLWSPPRNANQVLRSGLLRWAGLEQLLESPDNRTTASEYIRQLEQGSSIEVQGYQWSTQLWSDSFLFDLPSGLADETPSREEYKRPVKIVRFGKDTTSLAMPYSRFDETKDLTGLYASSFDWVTDALSLAVGVCNE